MPHFLIEENDEEGSSEQVVKYLRSFVDWDRRESLSAGLARAEKAQMQTIAVFFNLCFWI